MESFLYISARRNIRCAKWILIFLLLSTTPRVTVGDFLSDTSDQSNDFFIKLMKDNSTPIIRGDDVNVLSTITFTHSDEPEITWYMGDRRINTDLSVVFDTTLNKTIVTTSFGRRYIYQSSLKMKNFISNLLGSYTCKVKLPYQADFMTVGTVVITQDMFAEPEVQLRPSMLVVQPNTIETICCYYKHVDRLVIEDDSKAILTKDVNFSDQMFILFHPYHPSRPSTLRCKGYIKGRMVSSNEVPVTFVSKGDKICPANVDSQGTNWTSATASSLIHGDCPEGYTGHATRQCKADGTWAKANHTNCTRKDLGTLMQDVKLLQGLAPSADDVANVSSHLSQSMANSEPMLATDVMQTVNIMDEIGVMSSNDSDETMITTQVVHMVANITNHLLNEMDHMEEAHEKVEQNATMEGVVGARLLFAVDNLVAASLREANFSSKPIVMKNVVIKRDSMDTPKDVLFPDESDRSHTAFKDWLDGHLDEVFLPSSVFPSDLGTVRYSATLLRKSKFVTSFQNVTFDYRWVLSNVLAFSTDKKVNFETSQIEMSFGVPIVGYVDPMCAFLDPTASEMGVWSMRGCEVDARPGVVSCKCNHLTNFAVLMSPSPAESAHADALSIISIVGCAISIACLLALLVIYAIFWKYMKKDRKICLHVTLSICLLLVYIIFVVGVERTSHEPQCTFIAAILHYLLLVVFFIMLCEGVEISMAVLYVFTSSFSVWKLLVPSFVIPALIVAITLGVTHAEDYRSADVCWLSWSSGTIWSFVGPSLAVILVNYIVLAITLRVILNSVAVKKSANVDKVKMSMKSVAILSPVLGLTWFIGVLSVNEDTIVFQYLFAICNSLQGLVIFIVHCLMSHQVKDAYAVFKRKQKARSLSLATSSSYYSSSCRKFSADPSESTVSATNLSQMGASTSSNKSDFQTPHNLSLVNGKNASGPPGIRVGQLRQLEEDRKSSVCSTTTLEEFYSSSPVSNNQFVFANFDALEAEDNATDSGMEESNHSVCGSDYQQGHDYGYPYASDFYYSGGSVSPYMGRPK